jgi:hypothetical protein
LVLAETRAATAGLAFRKSIEAAERPEVFEETISSQDQRKDAPLTM